MVIFKLDLPLFALDLSRAGLVLASIKVMGSNPVRSLELLLFF